MEFTTYNAMKDEEEKLNDLKKQWWEWVKVC